MSAADIEAAVARVVDQAPPLSPERLAQLAAILRTAKSGR